IGNAVDADRLNFWNSQTGDIISLSGNGSVAVGAPSLYTAQLNVSADSDLNRATLRLHETAGNDVARLEFTNANTSLTTRKWHIAGFIGAGGTDTDRLSFWNSGAGDILWIAGNGRVGIAQTNPGARLHVQGESGNQFTAIITGSGGQLQTDWPTGWAGGLATWDICAQSIRYSTLSSRSDERLKRDITPLDAQYELQRLLQLRPVSYFWRDEQMHKAVGEQPQFGFIAQELREIFPELVLEGGEDNILSVNYQALIPLLVNAIQLQQREIEQLRAEVQQLRAQVKR
ncbi:MAG: tail fiber domain-containing protein, partial [Fimbriimonadales bacterium]|nr:tail fiber domain-containing protein [Fimbriimonadales bacterium]